jgi:predicted DCC family thiol-disulfide oxidoreductase YuxK
VPAPEVLFYDGSCGLCHRTVRILLAIDRRGEAFRFAPLFGRTFLEQIPEAERAGLPDSFVLRTGEGALLTRSGAVLHVLRRLGGVFWLLATLGGIVPRVVRDALYDFVARVRRKLFARPDDVCPLVPKEQRARFLP